MVVDDVEDDRDPERVGAVDERAQVVGPAVEARRGEQIDAVVAPAERSREVGERQQLHDGDAEVGEFRQVLRMRRRRCPRS